MKSLLIVRTYCKREGWEGNRRFPPLRSICLKQIAYYFRPMDWIHDEEKLLKIQENYIREPMDEIKCVFLYMNKNNYLEQITTEYEKLNSLNHITKERVLQIVQEKRLHNPKIRYTLTDIWLFHVDLEPTQIPDFSKTEDLTEISHKFIRHFPTVDDIPIPPSIFIFHRINALYFLLTASDVITQNKSCLKQSNTAKTRKKVCFITNNKTRKSHFS